MLLFLSHSGTDTDAVVELKRRMLAAPAAQVAGLDVWLDVDELRPGDQWQPALEEALGRADTFLVYVGSRGVVNWVDREVRHALVRATGEQAIQFLPVLASADLDEGILPPFARQFQAVTDPLGDETALAALIAAILDDGDRTVPLIDRPFVGLSAMGEAEADRFFGRDDETEELAALLQRHRLVAVVADSGAGKSSLVRAGLVPAFRGGVLQSGASLHEERPRHVVIMRPGADPLQGLRDGIDRAARSRGLATSVRRSLRQSVKLDDPGETFYGLACDIDHDSPDILLVVDQFEELVTMTQAESAAAFTGLLMALSGNEAKPVRVVLTVRADYFNLIRQHEALFAALQADDGAAQLRLKRISDEGLYDIVNRPLVMAGHGDASERDALYSAIQRDMTGRPGDLALVQMALYATWRRMQEGGEDLTTAYAQVHGVLGALAHQAEQTRQGLGATEQEALLPLFVRLVRLGDTGGATRRVAALADLGPDRAALAQKLASEEAGRLLMMVGGDAVEIAHEALVQQWPWLQAHMQESAEEIRTLARLGDRTKAWTENGAGELPPETERRRFEALAERHRDWLSEGEHACLAAARRRALLWRFAAIGAVAAVLIFGIVAALMGWRALVAEKEARVAENQAVAARNLAQVAQIGAEAARDLALEREQALREQALVLEEETRRADAAAEEARSEAVRATVALEEAARNAAGGLVGLAEIAKDQGRWEKAIKLALASWPRRADEGVGLMDVVDTLSTAMPRIAPPHPVQHSDFTENRATFAPDGRFYVYQPRHNAPVSLRRTDTGETLLEHETYVHGTNFRFSRDGRFFAAGSRSRKGVLVALDSPREPLEFEVGGEYVTGVAFSLDGERLYAATPQGSIYEYRTDAPDRPVNRHSVPELNGELWFIEAAPDGEHLLLGTRQGTLGLWNLRRKLFSSKSEDPVRDLTSVRLFMRGGLVATTQRGGLATLWNAGSLRPIPHIALADGSLPLPELLVTEHAIVGAQGRLLLSTTGGVRTIRLDQGALASNGFLPINSVRKVGPADEPYGRPASLAISPDGKTLAVEEGDGILSLWDLGTNRRSAVRYHGMGSVRAMAFAGATGLALVNVAGTSKTIDLSTPPDVVWRNFDVAAGSEAFFSPDWSHMGARSSGGRIVVHTIPEGRVAAHFEPRAPDSRIGLARGGKFAVERGETYAFYDLRDGSANALPVVAEQRSPSGVDVWSFSSTGRYFVVAGGARYAGWVQAFETATGKQVLDAKFQRTGQLDRLAFASDIAAVGIAAGFRVRVASASDGLVWFRIDGSNDRLKAPPEFPRDTDGPAVAYLANLPTRMKSPPRAVLTPDRERLALIDQGAAVVYDTGTGTVIARLEDKLRGIGALAFPGSEKLHIVTTDGRLGTWNLNRYAKGSAFQVACRLLSDPNLDDALRGYPISAAPICEDGYDPPLPEWLREAREALGLAQAY